MSDQLHFNPLYPDVLGAIAGNLRVTVGDVQVAVGVFPRQVYYNQPVEIVVVVQSLVDQKRDLRLDLDLPKQDANGKSIHLSVPKQSVSFSLTPGEVGVLRLPLLVQLPTQPEITLPITAIVHAAGRPGVSVRLPGRGAPPSVVTVSPFKMQVLRDVEFFTPADPTADRIVVEFDLAARRLPPPTTPLKPVYERLWTEQNLPEERQHIAEHLDQARMIASAFTADQVFLPLLRALDDRFGARGLPLHPGEARAIAKIVTYTLDTARPPDPVYRVEQQRWFQMLAHLIASDSMLARRSAGEVAADYLLESAVYDSVLQGFNVIRPLVRSNLGDRAEREGYGHKLLAWLSGQGDPDISFIFLPLVLAGASVNHLIMPDDDDPWLLLSQLREAYRARIRVIEGADMEILDLLDTLITRSENELIRLRIPPR